MSIWKQLVRKTFSKKAIIATLLLGVPLSIGILYFYYQTHVSTIYHVYLNGDKIGIVDAPKVIEDWKEKKNKDASNQFSEVQMQENNQLSYEGEELYKPKYDNESALDKLEEEFTLMASAVELFIDGEFIGYAPDQEVVEKILDSIKLQYVSEEDLLASNVLNENKKRGLFIASVDDGIDILQENTDQDSVSQKESENDSIDEHKIVEITIVQEIEMEGSLVHPSQVLSYEHLRERLMKDKTEQSVYTVKEGDVLGTIALQFSLTMNELIDLNYELKKDSVLQIGQELVVLEEERSITVATVEKVLQEETIPFKVETRLDSTMYRGESRTVQEGENGKKLVEYIIYKENGRIKMQEIVNEEILTEPVSQVIMRGDKVKPSRESG